MVKINIKQRQGFRHLILLVGLTAVTGFLGGCSQSVLTQEDIIEKAKLEAQEKQVMQEKKTLSDFVNKAYSTTQIKDLPSLIDSLTIQMNQVTQDTAVKMMLHLEMAQRIVLQNDVDFGEISPELSTWLATQPSNGGILSAGLLKDQSKEFSKELEIIDQAYMGIQKLGDRYYLAIDFSKYKKFNSKLTLEYNLYQEIMSSETNQPSVLNQEIQLSPEVLIQRLLKVDEFYRDHPIASDGIIQNNMGDEFKLLIRLVLYGTSQNPQWDAAGKLKPEWQIAYTNTVFAPNSKLNLPFETLKQKLIAAQWVKTPEIEMQIQDMLKVVKDLAENTAQ